MKPRWDQLEIVALYAFAGGCMLCAIAMFFGFWR